MAPKARLLRTAFVGHRAAWCLPGVIGKQVSTTDEAVPENALAGTIPTEIGQLAELRELHAHDNQLTGVCLQIIFLIDGKRVYHELKTTFLLHRQHPDGARALHWHDGALAGQQRIDR